MERFGTPSSPFPERGKVSEARGRTPGSRFLAKLIRAGIKPRGPPVRSLPNSLATARGFIVTQRLPFVPFTVPIPGLVTTMRAMTGALSVGNERAGRRGLALAYAGSPTLDGVGVVVGDQIAWTRAMPRVMIRASAGPSGLIRRDRWEYVMGGVGAWGHWQANGIRNLGGWLVGGPVMGFRWG